MHDDRCVFGGIGEGRCDGQRILGPKADDGFVKRWILSKNYNEIEDRN